MEGHESFKVHILFLFTVQFEIIIHNIIIKSPSHGDKSVKVQRHHKLAAVAYIKTLGRTKKH